MDLTGLLLYSFVILITPGPNNLTMMYLSARHGFRRASRFMWGSTLGITVKALLCGLLNVFLTSFIPAVLPYMKWLGGLYMLYLAYRMLASGFAAEEQEAKHGDDATFAAGILLQCVNIKSWLGCLGMFVFVVPYTRAFSAIAAASLINSAIMVLCTTAWGLSGVAFRRVYAEHRRAFSVLLAASLIFCAYSAVR